MSMVDDEGLVDFAAGGGKSIFYNASEVDLLGESGDRTDGRDLITEAADAGVRVAQTKEEFMDLVFSDG